MIAPGCYRALAAVGRSPPQAYVGPRRWRQASAPAPLSMSTTTSRRSLASRAAIDIPPDALVHPCRETFESHQRWGIEKKEEGKKEKVTIWLSLTGIDELKVRDEVKVDLPDGSNVLTIKRTKKDAKQGNADPDELLDVRLLLTAGYNNRNEITVENKGKQGDGKVRLEVTFVRDKPEVAEININ